MRIAKTVEEYCLIDYKQRHTLLLVVACTRKCPVIRKCLLEAGIIYVESVLAVVDGTICRAGRTTVVLRNGTLGNNLLVGTVGYERIPIRLRCEIKVDSTRIIVRSPGYSNVVFTTLGWIIKEWVINIDRSTLGFIAKVTVAVIKYWASKIYRSASRDFP